MTIGEKIKKYRKIFDITQQELAEYCHINVATIKKYELGQRNPKPEQIAKIAKGLGLNPFLLYDYEIKTVGDVMSLLFMISDLTDIELKEKESDDEYSVGDVSIHFKDRQLNFALSEWNDMIRVLNGMRNNELLEKNSDIQKSLSQKADEMEAEFRFRIIEDNLSKLSKGDEPSPKLNCSYYMEEDAIEAERLGISLIEYVALKNQGMLPYDEVQEI